MRNIESGMVFGKLPNMRDESPYKLHISFLVVLGISNTENVYRTIYFAKITPNDDDPNETKLEVLKVSEKLFAAFALDLDSIKKFKLRDSEPGEEVISIAERVKSGQFQFSEIDTPAYL